MKKTLIIYLLVIILGLSTACAKSFWSLKDTDNPSALTESCFRRLSDTTGEFWISYSNRLTLGDPFDGWDFLEGESVFPDNVSYRFNASYPSERTTEYLNGAGLWIGGIKGNDTLVTLSFDCIAPVPELMPQVCTENDMSVIIDQLADREVAGFATDTILATDTVFRCLVGDCNDWYPLGIEVGYTTYRWESPPYDNILWVSYSIHNIDTLALEEGWVGIYTDCDIGSQTGAHSDDVSGYIDGALTEQGAWVDLQVGYSVDMDGDPFDFTFGQDAHTGAFAAQFLGISSGDPDYNFNWWTDGETANAVTAPRKAIDDRYDLGGSFAVALGDSNKYHVLSYNEHDYNQLEAGYLHSGWINQGDAGIQIASGGDTRFLLSAGPFTLLPNETVEFSVAYYIVDNVVTNPFVNSWFNPRDPQSVADYYETLNLTELQETAIIAQDVYESGWTLPPPGPPLDFELVSFTDTSASFQWSTKEGLTVAGYHLKYSFDSITWYDADEVASEMGTATGLISDSLYYFSVASYNTNLSEGKISEVLSLVPKAPHPPYAVTGNGLRAYPELSWDYDIAEAPLTFRIYRLDPTTGISILFTEETTSQFIDYSTQKGQSYTYRVTAVSAEGIESPLSQAITIVPMPMTSGIFVLDQNSYGLFSNLVFDRERFNLLIDSALSDFSYTKRTYDPDNPITLEELSDYSLLILSSENRSGSIAPEVDDILRQYLVNGGKILFLLRIADVGVEVGEEPVFKELSLQSFLREYLFIDSVYWGRLGISVGLNLEGDLIGATPEISMYPELSWDSLEVNSFAYSCTDGIPYGGFIVPRDGAEVIYRYNSSDPGGEIQGRVNGIKYLGDDYRFVLLNMPLSLMQVDSASVLLQSLVYEMGEEFLCGDVNGDFRVNVGDVVSYISFLYHDGSPPRIIENGDVNCDTEYAMDDLLVILNYALKYGLSPACCE